MAPSYCRMDQQLWVCFFCYVLLICTGAVDCYNNNENPTKARVELGNWRSKGKLDLFYNGHWGAVCARRFGKREATVACRMLGFNGTAVRPSTAYLYQHRSRLERSVHVIDSCQGTELSLDECGPIGRKYLCGLAQGHFLVGVDCNPGSAINEQINEQIAETEVMTVHLDPHGSVNTGLVAISFPPTDGESSVCGATWGPEEATVVCKELGFTGYDSLALEVNGKVLRYHGLPTELMGVDCEGREVELRQCVYQPRGDGACPDTAGKAGVSCEPETHFETSLRGGRENGEGWVVVNFFNRWTKIVHSEWTGLESTVICRAEGYLWGASDLTQPHNGLISGWRFYGNCNGDEISLLHCNISKWQLGTFNMTELRPVYVKCYNDSGPSRPIFTGMPESLRVQDSAEVSCEANGGDYDVTVALECPGANNTNGIGLLRVQTGRRVVVSTNLVGSHAVSQQKPCTCSAVNEKGWFAKTETWPNVFFGPDSVRVIRPTVAPQDGTVFTLACETDPSNPPSEITWYNGTRRLDGIGKTYTRPSGVMSYRTYNHWYIRADQSMTGNVITCLGRNPTTNQTWSDSQVLSIGTILPDMAHVHVGLAPSNMLSASSLMSFLRSSFGTTFGNRPSGGR